MHYSEQENEEFFKWLLDKNSINMESTIDLTLCKNQDDPSIYYPEEIGNFFRTSPMQRISRILQLGRFVNADSTSYHTRFEHCLGTFNQKKNILIRLYKDVEFRKYIENNNLKIYLIAELIKSAGHDIGHLPLSHVLEQSVVGKHDFHEDIGKRILLENEEIQNCLIGISPELPEALSIVLSTDFFGFKLIDEGSYDIDRFDYITRDSFYKGKDIQCLEFMPFTLKNNIPVFDISSMDEIVCFLNTRIEAYKNGYIHPLEHLQSNVVSDSINAFIENNEIHAQRLQQFLIELKSAKSPKDINLDEYLYWDDLNFYNELLDVAEFSTDPNMRHLATICVPNLNSFMNILYTMLDLKNTGFNNLSDKDKSLILRIKSYINSDSEIAKNLRDPHYFEKMVLCCYNPNEINQIKNDQNLNQYISFCQTTLLGYNPNEPIYIQNTDGKIYTIDNIPGVDFNISKTPESIEYAYCLLPLLKNMEITFPYYLKPASISKLAIPPSQKNPNMSILRSDHKIEEVFEEYDEH